MGLIIKSTEEKKITIPAADIQLNEVYGRVRFLAGIDGRTIEFETAIWLSKEKYQELSSYQNILQTDIPVRAIKTELAEGEDQSLEMALISAKEYFEELGYDVEIENTEGNEEI